MNTAFLRRKSTKLWTIFSLLCLLITSFSAPRPVRADPGGCSVIYDGGNGWVIELCTEETNPNVPPLGPMDIFLDGVSKGDGVVVRIYHQSQDDPGIPQVAVIYSSGYIRLKQNADPNPAIPFGSSFILGPGYWANANTLYNNPTLTRLEISTTWLPDSPLRMKALGTNHAFKVTYNMELPPPRDRQTRLHVEQIYTATANINVPAGKRQEKQGFKLVQFSSMFIKDGSPCDGGYTDCHDSNDIRFIASDLNRRQFDFSGVNPPGFIMTAPRPLSTTWLDLLHKDDVSWHSQTGAGTSGNTPNLRIALDELPTTYTITPRGYITPTTDPNNDNVNVWLHDDRESSRTWAPGKKDRIGYWLLAQDNPPDPWEDLDLRKGDTFLDFNGPYNCYLVKSPGTTGKVIAGNGYEDRSLRLQYDLGNADGNWVQARCDFNPPLDLSAYDHLRFEWLGRLNAANSLEVGLIDVSAHIFAHRYERVTHHHWWGQMIIPFKFLQAWTPGTQFDPSQVSAFIIAVKKADKDDKGGKGILGLDNLGAFNIRSRTVPASFESVDANPVAAQAAANWLVSQQHLKSGLLRSWEKDQACWSYTYDQALALIVFSKQGMWEQANKLAARLVALQNPDGSWHQRHDCNQMAGPGAIKKWEGDIAWAIYALRRYQTLGGTRPVGPAIRKGADWLAKGINPKNGCLMIREAEGEWRYHTEATIDAWWAFQAAGPNHVNNANKIKNCLLKYYWDPQMGRFKGGRNWWQPYLDNQTWGAAFLKAIGQPGKALRALSYARNVLVLPAQGGQLFGFDGQGGPWSVWNEGTAQYAAVGGEGANDFLAEVLAQQRKDGAVPGSPDNFSGGGVWTTRWVGVAPTAWLYNALSDEPFHPSP